MLQRKRNVSKSCMYLKDVKIYRRSLFPIALSIVALSGCLASRKHGEIRSLDETVAQITNQEDALKVFYDLVDILDKNVYNIAFDAPEQVGEKLGNLDQVARELGLVNTTGLRFEFKAKRLANSASENPFDLLGSWSQVKQLPVGSIPLVSDKITQIEAADPAQAEKIWAAADGIAAGLWTQPDQPLPDNLFRRLAAAEAAQSTGRGRSVSGGGLQFLGFGRSVDSAVPMPEFPVKSLAGRDTKGKPGSIPITRTEYRYSGAFHSPEYIAAKRKAEREGVEFLRQPENIKIRVRNYYDAEFGQSLLTAANISAISLLLPDFANYPVRFWEFKTTDGQDPQGTANAVRVRKYRLPVYSHDVRILANETALQYALEKSTDQPLFSSWGRQNPQKARNVEALVDQVLNDREDIVQAVRAAGKSAKEGKPVSLIKAILARPAVAELFKDPYKPEVPLLSLIDGGGEGAAGKNLLQRFSEFVNAAAEDLEKLNPSVSAKTREQMLNWVRGFQARTFVLSMWHADFLKTSAFSQHKSILMLSKEEAESFDLSRLSALRPQLREVAQQAYAWSRQMTLTTDGLFRALSGPNAFPTQYIMQYKRLSFEVAAKGNPGSDTVYPVQITLDRDIELRSPVGTRFEMPFQKGAFFDDLEMAFPPNMVVAEVKFPDGTQYGLDDSPQMQALYWYREQVLANRMPESKSTAGKNYVAAEVIEGPVGRAVRAYDFAKNWSKYLQLGYPDMQYDGIRGVSRMVTNLLSFAPLWKKSAQDFCTLVGAEDQRLVGRDVVECVSPDQPL